MNKRSHKEIALRVLDKIQGEVNWKINRQAYIFGSIAPDINCIYPMHNIQATFSRFTRRVSRVDRENSVLLKSFTLGVITHYICDYFCLAHNIKAITYKHHTYEKLMLDHIHSKEIDLGIFELCIEDEWDKVQSGLVAKYTDEIKESKESHTRYVLESLTGMHREYMCGCTARINIKNWHQCINQIYEDVGYSVFMSVRLLELVLIYDTSIA